MASKKENLSRLLDFIDKLVEEDGNEWFKLELQKRMFRTSNVAANDDLILVIGNNVDSIHKYLKLDVIPMIDYSAIKDEKVKNQLYRDCLEMGKYRLGKINDTINFDEFCRYAHYQAEELINYFFFTSYNGDMAKIIVNIKNYSNYDPSSHKWPPRNLNNIDFGFKCRAIKGQLNIPSNINSTLFFLKDLRNYLSHRNSLDEVNEDQILIKYTDISKKLITDDIEMTEDERNLKNKCDLIHFKRNKDFNAVYEAVNMLKNKIVENLNRRFRNII